MRSGKMAADAAAAGENTVSAFYVGIGRWRNEKPMKEKLEKIKAEALAQIEATDALE